MQNNKRDLIESKVNEWRATPGLLYKQIETDEDLCYKIEEFYFNTYVDLLLENFKKCLKSNPSRWKELSAEYIKYNNWSIWSSRPSNSTFSEIIRDSLNEAGRLAEIKIHQQSFSV